MALNPYTKTSRESLQPGARGEIFQVDMPGYRDKADRINRTNTKLNLNDHDVLNIKYGMDPRLPVLFKYGFAHGYNQLVIPKGRIVAVDPNLNTMDTDTLHFHNTITLANGGKDVELQGKLWVETTDALTVDETTGFMNGTDPTKIYRAANKPIGIMERNEYTRDDDAHNGMMPGPVRTDAMVELPIFVTKEKAEGNPWGSIYADVLKPGDLVKADTNGRVILSPLNERHPEYAAVMADLMLYEKERQQLIGTVYSTDFSLLPEGAAKFAQWAIDDRLKFDDFNPLVRANSNRRGEDVVRNVPTMYQSQMQYPGYPYDRTDMTHDLHMLASTREGMFDPRFDEKHRLDRGIPGLTDGYNAVVQSYGFDTAGNPSLKIGSLNKVSATDFVEGHQSMFRLPDTDLQSAKIWVGTTDQFTLIISPSSGETIISQETSVDFKLSYVDLHKGLIAVEQINNAVTATETDIEITVGYEKRGMAGVPTNLDWDGCKGTAKILLQL